MRVSRNLIDRILAKDQLQALQAMHNAWGVELFLASMMWILTKEEQANGQEKTRIIPFQLNKIQHSIESNLALWNLLLKPRQTGGTTYFLLRRLLLNAILDGGIGGLLISQSKEFAQEHFQILRRAYNLIGAANPGGTDEENQLCISLKQNVLHTAYSNRRELVLDYLDSKIRIASAEVEESGQGITLHNVIASEYARWPGRPEDTLSNVMGAMVPGGTLDRESTANGAAGPFYEACLRAMNDPKTSDAKLHYFGWHWDDGYENELDQDKAKELEADLQADEIRLIKKMHSELSVVAYAA